ncbi:MAG: transposase [Steroidobacteraceae bacterium]|jgi:transposase-like protein|nr:transposase [Steroidobacteraceae bacterium]
MNTYGVDLMGRRRRRRHSAEFKQSVVGECMRPGVSIAAVALHHGLNANMLRKWVIEAEHRLPPKRSVAATQQMQEVEPVPPTFVPLALSAPSVQGDIRIELQRAGTTVSITWPAAAARDCAAWLRDWLR